MHGHLFDGLCGTKEFMPSTFQLSGLVGFDFQWLGEIAVIGL